MQKIRFIINPISGINIKPKKIKQWIYEIFSGTPHKIDIVYTRFPGDGTRLGKEAVSKGYNIVVAVGGDGTINEIATALIGSQVVLGVVPAGSGNGFARNFSIPLNQIEALKILLAPHIISIDAGKINQHYFFNVAGIGLDAEISRNFEQLGVRGPLPYFFVGIKSYLKRTIVPVKIILNKQELEYSPLVLSIANAPQYGNGAVIAPHAKADDGFLDLCILDDMPFWKAALQIYRLFNGTINQTKIFHTFRIKELTINRNCSGAIHTDGNPVEDGELLKIEVLPQALKLAVVK